VVQVLVSLFPVMNVISSFCLQSITVGDSVSDIVPSFVIDKLRCGSSALPCFIIFTPEFVGSSRRCDFGTGCELYRNVFMMIPAEARFLVSFIYMKMTVKRTDRFHLFWLLNLRVLIARS
jgi:hypothetical protein